MNEQWISIFRAGTHNAKSGQTVTFSNDQIDQLINNYDPGFHEAPATIGHPADNKPAYGWVESLKRFGDTLYAKFKDLAPSFVEAVKQGLFKKRSVSIYPDLDGKGPYLRHVAFLGAAPPAVKGLADISLSERIRRTMSEAQHYSIEFSEPERAGDRLESLTKAKMKEKSLPYSLAFSEVQIEHPELTQEYMEAIHE
jgi:hypothetical protein